MEKYPMNLMRFFGLTGWAGGCGVALALGWVAPAMAQEPRSFLEWCQQADRLNPGQQRTIAALLAQAGTEDCGAAAQGLAGMVSLGLGGQNLTDLSPLASLSHLQSLDLSFNQIQDLSPLAGLTQLQFLLVAGNQITDISPLAGLTGLSYLVIEKNQVRDLGSLGGLTALRSLIALDNPINPKKCPVEPVTVCLFSDDGGDGYAMAEAAANRGEFGAALEGFGVALAVYEAGGDRQRQGDALNRMGDMATQLGQYAKALELYQRALELRRGLQDFQGIGVSLTSLGEVYQRLGRYDQAVIWLQKALENLAEQERSGAIPLEGGLYQLPRDQAVLYQRLAVLYSQQGDQKAALEAIDRSLERYGLIPEEYPGKMGGQRVSLATKGLIYGRSNLPRAAVTVLQESLALAEQMGDQAGQAQALTYLGEAQEALGDSAQALATYDRALALHRQSGDPVGQGMVLHRQGQALLKADRPQEATAALLAAIAQWEALRPGLTDENKVALFETQAASYGLLQESLLAQGQPEAALEASERGRARAFVELMARRQGAMALGQLQQVDPPTVAQMRRLAQEQQATLVEYSWVGDRLLIWVIQPDGVVTLRTQDLQNLTAPDRPDTPANGNNSSNSSNSNPGGQNRGGNGLENLIQQLRDSLNPGTNAFGLQSESNRDISQNSNQNSNQNTSQNPSRSSNPRDRLERIRQQAQAGQQRDLYLAEAYNILIAPIADLLPPDPDDLVIIVPHRSLFLVPFAALPTPTGDRLIQHHTLSLAPSLQALSLSQPTPHPFNPQQALIVGNPTMPSLPPALGAAPLTLQPLPGAETEAQTIGQLLGVRPLLGEEATEAAVLDRLPQASLVHLATHGLLDELEALDLAVPGAIALAPNVPYQGDLARPDGLLTASEILDLRLQADLVVLSACNTGRGTLTEDGVIGLSRSLLAAGTPSVLVSLWAVPDAPTATLMVAFYQALQNQPPNTPAPKARALRQAMLATAATTPDPQDWAAFLLMGSAQ